ncbi:hypothetical protein [Thioalkalivibrio sp. ALR17-21]|uniref:hypothetical protein n=1 Tax=Thioalkalivibrio sp. ALR17-21 TaxID=1269813 RepID=UPI0004A342D3|nr:hypothetical protein [Thioalkalivibrio sp. ALR17-21]
MKETDSPQDQAPDGGNEDSQDITSLLKTVFADLARVVAVESRLFGYTLLVMLGLVVAIALLLVASWLFAGAALVVALANLQAFSLMGALLAVTLAHLVLAGLTFWRLHHITRDLTFRESRASVNSLLAHAKSVGDAPDQPPPER